MTQIPISPIPSGSPPPGDRYAPTPWSSQRFFRPYIKSAIIVAVTLGFSTGTVMLFLPAFGRSTGQSWIAHLQAHGVAQIFGWAGLFLMGMAFHIVPRFRNGSIVFPWPQRIALALILLSILSRFIGQTVPSLVFDNVLLVASGVGILISVGIFVVTIGAALRTGTTPHTAPEKWLWMSLVWSLVAAGLHLVTVIDMATEGRQIASARPDGAFVHAGIVGFLANFIFGISLRSVSAFLALPPARLRLNLAGVIAMNSGIAVTTISLLFGLDAWVMAVGAGLELAGFAAFVNSLRLFARRDAPRSYTLSAYGRYEWFLRTSYGWLLIGGGLQVWNAVGAVWPDMAPPSNLANPALHVVSLGFVTMIIMGMASRMIPLFEGSVLPAHRLMDAVFASLNASVALRLLFGIASTNASWKGLAVSGTLGTFAMICFAWIIWRTMQPGSRRQYVEMAQTFGIQQAARARRQRDDREPPTPM